MLARLIVRTGLWLGVQAALLFGAAGTVRWPGAWVYLIEIGAGGLVIGSALARHDPALLAERLAPPIQRGQAGWDRSFMAGAIAAWCAWLVVMGLDAGRWHWSALPPWLQGVGALGVALSLYVGDLALRANSFSAPVVRIQAERNHRVVTAGPYRVVRHPMYSGALLHFLGTPLVLGSWRGLALAPVLIAGLALRAVLEERLLAARLDGYAAYAARVRYRLIPGVW
jgi:protein-S-isoprenylcysteine O-methyltransferase Ste14